MSSIASQFDLTGKTALITGASSGLGVEFAHALVRGRRERCARRTSA